VCNTTRERRAEQRVKPGTFGISASCEFTVSVEQINTQQKEQRDCHPSLKREQNLRLRLPQILVCNRMNLTAVLIKLPSRPDPYRDYGTCD